MFSITPVGTFRKVVRQTGIKKILLAVATSMLSVSAAHAQTNGTWNVNNAAAANWSLNTNWLGSTIPGSGGVATFSDTFGQTASRTVTQDVAGLTLSGLTLNSPFIYTISGAQSITGAASGFTINVISSNAASPVSFGNGDTISAVIAGTGGLTKTGLGTVSLSGTNTFSGTVAINQGELRIANGDATLGSLANTVTIDGGMLRVSAVVLTTARALTIGSNGATFRLIANATFSGSVTGSGAMVHNIGSVLAFSGDASAYNGAIRNEAGTLTLSTFTAGQQLGGTAGLDIAGTLFLDSSVGNNSNRIGDTRGILSRGMVMQLTGNSGAATNELVGTLTSEQGNTVITVVPNAAQAASIEYAGLTRNNRSTLLFRGASLGGTPGANIANVLFTASPGTLIGGGGSPTSSTTASILPFAHGATSVVTTGTTFVTYDSVTKRIVPLDLTFGYTTNLAASTANDNVNQNATVALGSPVTINSLRVAPAAAITISGSQITINSGAILSTSTTATASALTTISAPITTPSGTELIIHGAGGTVETAGGTFGGLLISGVISGDNGLTKSGGGTLGLTGANTYTGQTTIAGGLVLLNGTIANDGTTPGVFGLSTSPIVLSSGSGFNVGILADNGTLTINRDIQVIGGGSAGRFLGNTLTSDVLVLNGNISISNPNNTLANGFLSLGGGAAPNGTVTVNGVISGTGGIADSTTPIINLNGVNTFSGGTQLNGGTYNLGNDSAFGTGVVWANTATSVLQSTSPFRQIANQLILQGNGVVFGGTNDLNWTGIVDLNGISTVTVNTTPGSLTFSGMVTRGSLVKNGAGTLIMSNTGNTYSGNTTIQTGTLIVAGNAGIASGVLGSSTITNVGRVLMGNASSLTTDNITFLTNGAFTIGAPIQVNAQNTTGLMTIGGSNTSGTATFSGFIGLNRGPTPTPTRFTAASGGTVDFTGQIFDFVAGSTVDVVGTGIVKFSNNTNSYAGATRVLSGATLIANNTTGSATGTNTVTVNAGGTLGGNGIIAGAVTSNGTISPGNSPGILRINNTVSFGSTGNFLVQIQGPGVFGGGVAGTDYDQLSLTNAATSAWTINPTATLTGQRTYTPAFGDAYVILSNASAIQGGVTSLFAGTTDGSLFNFDGQIFQIRYNVPNTFIVDPTGTVTGVVGITWTGDDGYGNYGADNGTNIVISAIPEPATVAMLGVSGIAAIGTYLRLRRRNKFDLEKNLSSVKVV